MQTQIATKITAFAAALMMNVLIVAGVGCLFNEQPRLNAGVTAPANAAAYVPGEVA